jgi:arylsulfatase A-like enzyme/Flp pilus assembly protein TadD
MSVSRSKIGWAAVVAVVVAAAGAGLWRYRGAATAPPPAAGALRGANVLLVTIDTLRADHVGAYGSALGLTPTLDRFASEGLRFDVAHAHVPMTLPSHTTIMTGLYPVANGVHDNGSFRFDGAKPTLAGELARAGYRTGAFIGAFVLDARFGLNAGFDVYDDRVQGASANLDIVQRTAEAVLAPAYDWIAGRNRQSAGGNQQSAISNQQSAISNQPWFAWVHIYDPHEPYTPPEPFAGRYAQDPYSGEIAYADASLGAFFDRLRSVHALDRTLVVLTSDHGEALGDHGERTHGLFAYESTLRVPLVVWAPGAIAPAVASAPARLVDIAPTILDLVGAPAATFDGRSLRLLTGSQPPADEPGSYFEALNANLTRNWAPLKGMVRGRLKLVDLPIPELYDLSADPGESRNLYAAQRERARDLESRLDRVSTGARAAPTPAPLDGDAEARLRSLGYVVGAAPRPARAFTPVDDPKRLVHLNTLLDEAAAALARGDAASAVTALQTAIGERPDLTIAYDRLAFVLRATGRLGEAVALLDSAARGGHADRPLLRSLGAALRDSGDTARSIAVLEPLARADASDVQTLDALGQTYARAGRPRDAESMFRRVLAASPNASATWNNVGSLYLSENRNDEALAALSKAVAINPDLAGAHNGLGVAYARKGELDRAAEEWRKALALRPDLADARANLARIAR